MKLFSLVNLKAMLLRLLVPVVVFLSAVFVFCFIHFKMNLFALASLGLGIICLLLAYLILVYAQQKMHRIWALLNFCLGIWGMGTFFVGVSNNSSNALIAWKFAFLGVLPISMLFYHMIYIFCGLQNRKMLIWAYLQGIVVTTVAVGTNWFINNPVFLFNSFYYNRANLVYFLVFISWAIVVVIAFFELYKFKEKVKGIKRVQAQYLFWAMLLGFAGGTTVIIPAFGILLYPYGHFFISIYAAISTYAIFRYQLMDIRVAVTRLGVFVVVYSLVLGIPFGLLILGKPWLIKMVGENWYWVPMIVLLILATAGPSIFIYFQRRTEDRILKEERRIQGIIKKASVGMVVIRDLRKLLKVIIDVLEKNLHTDYIAVYLFEPHENIYSLKASEPKISEGILVNPEDPLVQRLKDKKSLIFLDEMNYLLDNQKDGNGQIKDIITKMQELSASVIVPAIKEENLLAFIVLGKRKGKEVYSPDLLDVLSVVGNEVALAVENAIFYEESGKDWTERAHENRVRTMGALGTGIAHQMLNRFNVISWKCTLLKEMINSWDIVKLQQNDEFKKMQSSFNLEIEKMFKDIELSVEITQSIKNYSKKTGAEPQVTVFKEVVQSAMHLVNMMKKTFEFKLIESYPEDVKLWVNFSMLQDVFINAIDNSCDAMILKEQSLGPDNYKPQVIIRGKIDKAMFEFEIEDNGSGIKKEHLEEGEGVNVMYFTTKGATKGTGMGVPVMRQFAKYNGGSMRVESEYGQWTKIVMSLPLATGDQIEGVKNG